MVDPLLFGSVEVRIRPNIRPELDCLEAHYWRGRCITFMGIPAEEMTPDELIALTDWSYRASSTAITRRNTLCPEK